MPVNESQKRANQKWDRENMITIGCRLTRSKAETFKAACAALETNPSRVFLKAVDATIQEARDQE